MRNKQEQIELTELLRKEFLIDTQDITNSLNTLQSTLDGVSESILDKMQSKIANKKFNIAEYTNAITTIEGLKNNIKDLSFFLTCTEKEKNDWKLENLQSPSAFKTDPTIEHSLGENLQYKAPYGFSINRGKTIRVESWKHLFYKVCEFFFIMDEKLFMSFEFKKHMNGRSTKYFSTNQNDIVNPMLLKNKIYIKSMKSIDIIKSMIIKILDEYGYTIDDFILYLESDYSSLNN